MFKPSTPSKRGDFKDVFELIILDQTPCLFPPRAFISNSDGRGCLENHSKKNPDGLFLDESCRNIFFIVERSFWHNVGGLISLTM